MQQNYFSQREQSKNPLNPKSVSCNFDMEDINMIDPTTFSERGDFIR